MEVNIDRVCIRINHFFRRHRKAWTCRRVTISETNQAEEIDVNDVMMILLTTIGKKGHIFPVDILYGVTCQSKAKTKRGGRWCGGYYLADLHATWHITSTLHLLSTFYFTRFLNFLCGRLILSHLLLLHTLSTFTNCYSVFRERHFRLHVVELVDLWIGLQLTTMLFCSRSPYLVGTFGYRSVGSWRPRRLRWMSRIVVITDLQEMMFVDCGFTLVMVSS